MTQDLSPDICEVFTLPLSGAATIPWRYLAIAEHSADWLADGEYLGAAVIGIDIAIWPEGDVLENTGTVTPLRAPPEEATHMRLWRKTTARQPYLAPPAATGVEKSLDRHTLLLQEAVWWLERSLRSTTLQPPFVPGDAGALLMWDGDMFVAGPDGTDIAEASENATIARVAADQAAQFNRGPLFNDLAALLADSTMTYAVSEAQVLPGQIVMTRAPGFSYRVAAAGAVNHQLVTAGGVKLYVIPFEPARAFPSQAAAGGDTATITALEAIGPLHVDLQGGSYQTTLAAGSLANTYSGGRLYARNHLNRPIRVKTRAPYSEGEILRSGRKSPIISFRGKRGLHLGTSIPAQGGTVDSYPAQIASILGCEIVNMSFGSSHVYCLPLAQINPSGVQAQILSLSMTNADVAAGLALYGAGSVFDPAKAPLHAQAQTVEARIRAPWQAAPFDFVVLDHAHNDQFQAAGTLTPPNWAISGVTIGAQTTIHAPGHSFAVDEAAMIRVTGIAGLDYACGRVEAVAGDYVTIAYDSAGLAGAFTAGVITRLDRSTIFGGWDFVIAYNRNCALRYGAGASEPVFILATAPSEFSSLAAQPGIWAANSAVLEYGEARGFAVFDAAVAMRMKLEDQPVYFEDGTHATSYASRRVIANIWCEWLQGGVVPTINPDHYLIRARPNEPVPDQALLCWSDMDKGMVPVAERMAAWSVLASESFDASFAGWTTGGTPPVIAGGPQGNALRVQAAAGAQSYLTRALAFSSGVRAEFDLLLPATVGLVASGSSTAINVVTIGDGVIHTGLQLVITTTEVRLRALVRGESGNPATQVTGTATRLPLAAGRLYRVRLDAVRESAPGKADGRALVSLDGDLMASPLVIPDSTRADDTLLAIGIASNNTTLGAFTAWISNLAVETRERQTPVSGAIPAAAVLNVVDGMIVGWTL
ncbi:hypothetical protein [Pseudogemmobacter bohemicus]|uniref:hypothetical protein n=1 Tax=Pseudogemmobacter bohemicus TaxID=2250708 RepID=UPI000DD2F566|nr:hypothetical protein [Pseudogemmobacter bohemicus]